MLSYIINTGMHPPQNIYIKPAVTNSVSVVMAEAAALVLAATVTERLQIHNITFLSDNQELVNFFNSGHQSTPPDCRIKHLTQILINSTRQRNTRIYKIRRTQNHIAHTLAKQALYTLNPTLQVYHCHVPTEIMSYSAHQYWKHCIMY